LLELFGAFLSSISTPDFASKGYGFIVAGSRIGGIITPLFSWLLIEKSGMSDCISIPLLTASTFILFLMAIYCMRLISKKIPQSHLHGYEAAYNIEQTVEATQKKSGLLEGLRLMLTQPYVFGIFGLVFSFEVINIIFDYQMHVLMSIESHNAIGAMSSFMLIYTGTWQTLSLLFALFGTSTLIKRLGVQRCLQIMPFMSIGLALLPIIHPRLSTIFFVVVLLRALNYGFNQPLREILFIPTIKDIQFKSKAWIESFGRTFAKTAGSSLNQIAILHIPALCVLLESCFAVALAMVWALIALFVGKKYVKTIASNDVIGKKESLK